MSKVKYAIGIVLMLGFVVFVVLAPEEERIILAEGYPAPGFSLRDLGGRTHSLQGLRGSVVVVNFWATWCASCIEEMPSLDNLNKMTSDNPGFAILTVLFRDKAEKARSFLEQNGYGLTVLMDPDETVARKYGLTGVPETFVIDKEGVLSKKIIGPIGFDSPDVMRFFKRLASR